VLKKSFQSLNDKLHLFGIEESKITFIDGQAPFDSAFLSKMVGSLDISVENLGSGIEMIISLLFLETLSSLTKENIIIMIDEPELHLHPHLQEIFIQYLKSISSDKQILLSTHSPYFFKNCFSQENIKLLITETDNNLCRIKDSDITLKSFPWSPSWGEINYYAYGLATIEFHNELYGYLQAQSKIYNIKSFDNHLNSIGILQNKNWIQEKEGTPITYPLTLMTFIRNFIHHPENQNNLNYTAEELQYSISEMLKLIRRPPNA
jgi:hypothetical protein